MNNFRVTLKARLILYHKGSILLLKQTSDNGGNFTLVGGTIERKESAIETIIRESREEAGIILRKEDLELAHVLQKVMPGEQRVTLYYRAKRWSGKIKSREKDKFEYVEWFNLNQLPPKMTKTVAHVLRQYRHGKRFSVFADK